MQSNFAANTDVIRDRLVERAKNNGSAPWPVEFPGATDEALKLLIDLERYPHAYVIGCLMDRLWPAERVWPIPYALKQRLGTFEIRNLAELQVEDFLKVMKIPSPLHWLTETMGNVVFLAVQRILSNYNGDASKIWSGTPSSASIVNHFWGFHGAGQKIATMATNILVRKFRIPVSDRYSIDISVDTHIKRVFTRLGFVPEDASNDQIIFRAREMYPEYPGIFDLPVWELGRNSCCAVIPNCMDCYLADICPSHSENSTMGG